MTRNPISRRDTTLSGESIVVRRNELIFSELDDEIVALDVQMGKYFGLNATGAAIWKMLDAPIRVADICARLRLQFEVPPDQCQAEVLSLLGNVLRAGYIEQMSPPFIDE